nr:hypothetical protein GCM10020063_091350 [Dactylosporangium thailandense]
MVDLNEHNARDLLRAGLSAEVPRPPRVDVAAAVRDGRRRRSARRAALASGIAVAVAVVVAVPAALALTRDESAPPGQDPPTPATPYPVNPNTGTPGPTPGRSLGGLPVAKPPSSCDVHELPAPSAAGVKTLVTAASPDGRVHFGQVYLADNAKQVVRWRAGRPAIVSVEGDEPQVRDVNGFGDAVGDSTVDGKPAAWLLRDADDTVVWLPGGENASASAVNDLGEVAGDRGGHPIVWHDIGAPPVELPLPAGATSGEVRAVDGSGTVFGSVTVGAQQRAYAWAKDGTGRQLPLPPGTPSSPNGGTRPGPSSLVYDARAGWATGVAGLYSSAPRPVRWNLNTNTVEVLTGIDRVVAVNGSGFMIAATADGRAVLLAEDQRIVLPAIFSPTKDRANDPLTISDDGLTIAGQAWKTGSIFQAVVWTCH